MKLQNIFSLTVYKKTIWLQVVLDILTVICFFFGIILSQNSYILLVVSVIYSLLRSCYLIIIYVQILRQEVFNHLASLIIFSLINIVWWLKGMEWINNYIFSKIFETW